MYQTLLMYRFSLIFDRRLLTQLFSVQALKQTFPSVLSQMISAPPDSFFGSSDF